MSRKKLTYKDFKAYFSNNLQSKAKHDFEKEMMRDAFDEEAFDGLSRLNHEELENDISDLKSGILNRSKASRTLVPVWFKYAASILILVGVGLSVLIVNNQFWQNKVLKEQISEEMLAADSIIRQVESEIKQIAGEPIDNSDAKDFVADNREKTKQVNQKKQKAVKQEIKIEQNVVEDELLLEIEADEDVSVDILEFEEEETIDEVDELAVITDKSDINKEEQLDDIKESEKPKVDAVTGETRRLNNRLIQKKKDEAVQKELLAESQIEKTEEENHKIVIRGIASVPSKKSKQSPVIEKGTAIKGKVLAAEDGLSLPGVSIFLKDNPNIGTTTNIDGEFTLTIPESDEELKTLIASFVGMESVEFDLEGDSNLLVYMEPNEMEMDEVIVTGYSSNGNNSQPDEYINAHPPKGLSLRKYKNEILANIDYSKIKSFKGKHKIKVELNLSYLGTLNEIKIKNTPNEAFEIEIDQAIRKLGIWTPAKRNGNNVSSAVRFTLKIKIE